MFTRLSKLFTTQDALNDELISAVMAHNYTRTKKALNKGADANCTVKCGEIVFPLISLAIDYGWDLEFTMAYHNSVGGFFDKITDTNDIIILLIEFGCDVNAENNLGSTALDSAVRGDDLVLVKLLLSHGANPNHSKISSLLRLAIEHKNLLMVKELLNYGANPYQKDIQDFKNSFAIAELTQEKDIINLLNEFDPKVKYLKVLELEPNATKKDVVRAYRRLAHKYHPDRGGNPDLFKEVHVAYEFIKEFIK